MTQPLNQTSAPPSRSGGGRRALAVLLALDVALPLTVFYGLRLAGVNQWLALVLGAAFAAPW